MVAIAINTVTKGKAYIDCLLISHRDNYLNRRARITLVFANSTFNIDTLDTYAKYMMAYSETGFIYSVVIPLHI